MNKPAISEAERAKMLAFLEKHGSELPIQVRAGLEADYAGSLPEPEPVVAAEPTTARTSLGAVQKALSGAFLQRDAVIRAMLCALVAREHVLLLGPPGTAKSALARAFSVCIGSGASFFQWLLTRFSTPEELFGPISLAALKIGKFLRVIAGKLPEARIAFLDEIFKANSAILNALLTVLNERLFFNDGEVLRLRLQMVIGASNELPEGDELRALDDRFLVRFWIEPIADRDDFLTMVQAKPTAFVPLLSEGELLAAQEGAAATPITEAALAALWEIRTQLATHGIAHSDRRWKQSLGLVRASAWIDGDAEVLPEHFGILAHALWQEPEQRSKAAQVVNAIVSQELSEALEIHDAVLRLVRELPVSEADGYETALLATLGEVKRAEKMLGESESRAQSARVRSEIAGLRANLATQVAPLRLAAKARMGL